MFLRLSGRLRRPDNLLFGRSMQTCQTSRHPRSEQFSHATRQPGFVKIVGILTPSNQITLQHRSEASPSPPPSPPPSLQQFSFSVLMVIFNIKDEYKNNNNNDDDDEHHRQIQKHHGYSAGQWRSCCAATTGRPSTGRLQVT